MHVLHAHVRHMHVVAAMKVHLHCYCMHAVHEAHVTACTCDLAVWVYAAAYVCAAVHACVCSKSQRNINTCRGEHSKCDSCCQRALQELGICSGDWGRFWTRAHA